MSKATAAIKRERADVRRELRDAKRRVKELGRTDQALTDALARLEQVDASHADASSNGNGGGPRVSRAERARQLVDLMERRHRSDWTPTQLAEALPGHVPVGSLYGALYLAQEQGLVTLTPGEGAGALRAALVRSQQLPVS